jgi:hypothetical protein
MSTDPIQARSMNYWDEVAQRNWFDKLEAWKQRRYQRLVIEFYTAYRAYSASTDTPENPLSLDNCDCSHSSDRTAASEAEAGELSETESCGADSLSGEASERSGEANRSSTVQELNDREQRLLPLLFQMGVEDVDRAARIARNAHGKGDEAVFGALKREKERQWKVLSLLERGDQKHAYRLAMCGRQSVQLQCGHCESEDNYQPVSCDSRLCPDCQDKKIGSNIGKYRDRVQSMDTPVLLTLTEENVEDPVRGREAMMEDLGTLRRRTIPFEGSTRREADDGTIVEKEWCWWEGTTVDDVDVDQEQWKIKLQEQGKHELVRRLQRQYVNYEYEDITGRHVGRNIPFDELYEGGIYGIDIKQEGAFEFDVHAHVLLDMAYVPQAALSAVWEDITDGACVVDVRTIYNRRDRENVAEALAETVGYAVKPPEFEELEEELAFVEAAKGCPTVHPFGSLHGAGNPGGDLICSNCEMIPREWRYAGTVDAVVDNMGKSWETDRGKDPPG